MKILKVLIPLSLISLIYNAIVLISVALNLDWVRTRAAGGQFQSFPNTVRLLYLIMTLAMIYLMPLLWVNRNKVLSVKDAKSSKILGYVFIVSTFFQLISRSNDERWNAIPALILAFTFIKLSQNHKAE